METAAKESIPESQPAVSFTDVTAAKLTEIQLKRKELLKIVLELQKPQPSIDEMDGEGRQVLLSESFPRLTFATMSDAQQRRELILGAVAGCFVRLSTNSSRRGDKVNYFKVRFHPFPLLLIVHN
jgi:hypothetical protein